MRCTAAGDAKTGTGTEGAGAAGTTTIAEPPLRPTAFGSASGRPDGMPGTRPLPNVTTGTTIGAAWIAPPPPPPVAATAGTSAVTAGVATVIALGVAAAVATLGVAAAPPRDATGVVCGAPSSMPPEESEPGLPAVAPEPGLPAVEPAPEPGLPAVAPEPGLPADGEPLPRPGPLP